VKWSGGKRENCVPKQDANCESREIVQTASLKLSRQALENKLADLTK